MNSLTGTGTGAMGGVGDETSPAPPTGYDQLATIRERGPSAVGDLVHRGRTVATAEGRLVDERDRLIATATTTCLVVGGNKEEIR